MASDAPTWVDILAGAIRSGMTDSQIRERYGAGSELASVRRYAGVPCPSGERAPYAFQRAQRAASRARACEAVRLHREGVAVDRIAERMGLVPQTVRRYILAAAPRENRKARAADRRRCARMLADQGESRASIAERLGVSRRMVRYYLRGAR